MKTKTFYTLFLIGIVLMISGHTINNVQAWSWQSIEDRITGSKETNNIEDVATTIIAYLEVPGGYKGEEKYALYDSNDELVAYTEATKGGDGWRGKNIIWGKWGKETILGQDYWYIREDTYYVVAWGESTNKDVELRYDTGTNGYYDSETYNGFPDPASFTYEARLYSIYINDYDYVPRSHGAPFPDDEAIDVDPIPQCRISQTNPYPGSTGYTEFYENTTGDWVLQQTNSSGSSPFQSRWVYDNATEYSTTYYWRVIMYNRLLGYGFTHSNYTFSFTTGAKPPVDLFYTEQIETPTNNSVVPFSPFGITTSIQLNYSEFYSMYDIEQNWLTDSSNLINDEDDFICQTFTIGTTTTDEDKLVLRLEGRPIQIPSGNGVFDFAICSVNATDYPTDNYILDWTRAEETQVYVPSFGMVDGYRVTLPNIVLNKSTMYGFCIRGLELSPERWGFDQDFLGTYTGGCKYRWDDSDNEYDRFPYDDLWFNISGIPLTEACNLSLEWNDSGIWKQYGFWSNIGSLSYSQLNENFSKNGRTYQWRINITNQTQDIQKREWFQFETDHYWHLNAFMLEEEMIGLLLVVIFLFLAQKTEEAWYNFIYYWFASILGVGMGIYFLTYAVSNVDMLNTSLGLSMMLVAVYGSYMGFVALAVALRDKGEK